MKLPDIHSCETVSYIKEPPVILAITDHNHITVRIFYVEPCHFPVPFDLTNDFDVLFLYIGVCSINVWREQVKHRPSSWSTVKRWVKSMVIKCQSSLSGYRNVVYRGVDSTQINRNTQQFRILFNRFFKIRNMHKHIIVTLNRGNT